MVCFAGILRFVYHWIWNISIGSKFRILFQLFLFLGRFIKYSKILYWQIVYFVRYSRRVDTGKRFRHRLCYVDTCRCALGWHTWWVLLVMAWKVPLAVQLSVSWSSKICTLRPSVDTMVPKSEWCRWTEYWSISTQRSKQPRVPFEAHTMLAALAFNLSCKVKNV